MKILDRYIIKNFLGTFVFMLLILSLIVIVIDASSKLDRINSSGSTIWEALISFYPYWIVWLVNTFLPVAVFISVIYFTSRLTMRTELVAAMAGGISFYRLTLPYAMVALFIMCSSLAINNYLLPWANIKKNEYQYQHMLSSSDRSDYYSRQKISSQISKGEYIFVLSYDRIKRVGNNFVYQKLDSTGNIKEQLIARSFTWQPLDSLYVLRDYFYKNRIPTAELDTVNFDSLSNGPELKRRFPAQPDDILPEGYVAETMNTNELAKFIEAQKFKGSASVNIYQNEFHQRFSSPFSTLILAIFAFAISSLKRRGGIGINLALGLVLAFLYIFFGESSKIFSEKNILSPWLASWLPNIIFGILALIFYFNRARK